MIDVEMGFVWCKGVVFGMIASVVIKEFGEWVRSRRTQRAADFACTRCGSSVHYYDGGITHCYFCEPQSR